MHFHINEASAEVQPGRRRSHTQLLIAQSVRTGCQPLPEPSSASLLLSLSGAGPRLVPALWHKASISTSVNGDRQGARTLSLESIMSLVGEECLFTDGELELFLRK